MSRNDVCATRAGVAGETPESAKYKVEELNATIRKKIAFDKKYEELSTHIKNYKDGDAPLRGLLTLLDYDPSGRSTAVGLAPYSRALSADIHSRIAELIENVYKKFNTAEFEGVKAELGPDGINQHLVYSLAEFDGMAMGNFTPHPQISALAKQLHQVLKDLNTSLDFLGANIKKTNEFVMPQQHNWKLITGAEYDTKLTAEMRAANIAKWKDILFKSIDFTKMTDKTTGLPFNKKYETINGKRYVVERSPTELRVMFNDITSKMLDAIETDGSATLRIGDRSANNVVDWYESARFFKFKDAKSFYDYQKMYGLPEGHDPVRVILNHLDNGVKAMALLKVFGPEPEKMFNHLRDFANKQTATTALEKGEKSYSYKTRENVLNLAQSLFDDFRGGGLPKSEFIAQAGSASRAMANIAYLQTTVLYSAVEAYTTALSAAFRGMPVFRTLANAFKMAKGDTKLRQSIINAGHVASYINDRSLAHMRYTDPTSAVKWLDKMSEHTHRFQGSAQITEGLRGGFALSIYTTMAENAGTKWSDLNIRFRAMFEHASITEANWNTIRTEGKIITADSGATYFDIQSITDADLRHRMLAMVSNELDYASPMNSGMIRKILTFGTTPGTVSGEMSRNMMQFLSLPAITTYLHVMRGVHQAGAAGVSRGAYFARFIVGLTAMGMLIEMAKELGKGKDIKDPLDPMTITSGMVTGGALGPMADFIMDRANGYGTTDMLSILTGPGGDIIANELFAKVLASNAIDLFNEDLDMEVISGNTADDTIGALRKFTPYQNMYGIDLVVERLLWDQVQNLTDPQFEDRMSKRIRTQMKRTGQEYWWEPGQQQPTRAPQAAEAPE